jgi:hypothetical protein
MLTSLAEKVAGRVVPPPEIKRKKTLYYSIYLNISDLYAWVLR